MENFVVTVPVLPSCLPGRQVAEYCATWYCCKKGVAWSKTRQKEVAVLEESSAEPFKEAIIRAIPKLQDAGGKSSSATASSLVSWSQYHLPFRSHQRYWDQSLEKATFTYIPYKRTLVSLAAEEVGCDYDHVQCKFYVMLLLTHGSVAIGTTNDWLQKTRCTIIIFWSSGSSDSSAIYTWERYFYYVFISFSVTTRLLYSNSCKCMQTNST